MADVAEAMGVAKGTVYLYVESKEALFDVVLRYADVPRPIAPPTELPVKTPAPGRTLRYVRERLAERPASPTLVRARAQRPVREARDELTAIVRELYHAMSQNRTGLKLVDRCAPEYPKLASLWFGQGREALLSLLSEYIDVRVRDGALRKVPDVAVAARVIVETAVFWAVHRHWDPSPQPVEPRTAEETVVQMLVGALLAEGR